MSKYLTRATDGCITLNTALGVSAGASSAFQLIQTAADGKIDLSFISSFLFEDTSTIHTLTGDLTLTPTDTKWHLIDPNGANRIVDLPDPTLSLNKVFYVLHTGSSKQLRIYELGSSLSLNLNSKGVILCKSDGVKWNIIVLS